jgi:hypothetical protein
MWSATQLPMALKSCSVSFWIDDFVAIDEYLGTHDADYDKAKKMLQTMHGADSVGQGESYSGFIAEAGYYNSLGSEWKPWTEDCRKLAKFVLLNPQH